MHHSFGLLPIGLTLTPFTLLAVAVVFISKAVKAIWRIVTVIAAAVLVFIALGLMKNSHTPLVHQSYVSLVDVWHHGLHIVGYLYSNFKKGGK